MNLKFRESGHILFITIIILITIFYIWGISLIYLLDFMYKTELFNNYNTGKCKYSFKCATNSRQQRRCFWKKN